MGYAATVRRQLVAVCALICALSMAGCGIGYSRGSHNYRFEDQEGAGYDKSMQFRGLEGSVSINELTFYDESGILVSGSAQAGEKYMAKQRALDRARYLGKKRGEKIEYSYRKVAPVMGVKSSLSIIWGDGNGDSTVLANKTTEKVSNAGVSMIGFRYTAGLKQWDINHDANIGLSLVGFAMSYSSDNVGWSDADPSNIDWSRGRYGTPLLVSGNYRPFAGLGISAVAGFDPLFTAFTCMDACKPVWNAGAEFDWRVLEWLGVVGRARYYKDDDLSSGNNALEYSVGAYVMWEPEFWKRAKTGNYR